MAETKEAGWNWEISPKHKAGQSGMEHKQPANKCEGHEDLNVKENRYVWLANYWAERERIVLRLCQPHP